MYIFIAFVIVNIISFGLYFASMLRYYSQQKRYPLPENKYTYLLGLLTGNMIVILWFLMLTISSLIFTFFLFY